eukprot:CAMPEP_0194376264 /NCGR_PEP_ID=MMETSP0174-20130528/24692_1 /TAXON_ID=216777 /ORGANISM="Proboscia alata, Strain PI-D3" /LENGTH=1518 /DNA_ID=CAMNT_0039156847 /DNA_START=16 /DNA_END=4572 /DNA_ORIENTATION=-
MGVPKFYRWISERYPQINQVITDAALLPEFDHLYLDMNGIIHGCTHPSHMDVSERLSERDMMLGIMHYIDRIITQIVKPKVSVYMAIDGVAPRAKLNQQRSRRFRSAKDMAELMEQSSKDSNVLAGKNGDLKSDDAFDKPFDSNCITPGTEFMARVSDVIKYFIRKKIKDDPNWRNLKVIFSGHELPGEGEHKIMQHIREMRADPGYQPNTRHCMYGQDADLIMLGLVSHEPHFTLLREVVEFGMPFRNKNALKTVKKFTKESDFQLLHLSILREYLDIEFGFGLDKSSYDLERIIDDFTFMTFLVGNDFLPHLPSLDIGDGAFDLLFGTYKKQRLTWRSGEYLTSSGTIPCAERLEKFLEVIGAEENRILEERGENDAVYMKKRRKWDKRDGVKSNIPSDEQLEAEETKKKGDYSLMKEVMLEMEQEKGTKFVDGWSPSSTEEDTKEFKFRYYYEKLRITPANIDQHWALRTSYIEGLLWCLAYYYKGCISWGWFFPYHYGPMLSDLTDLSTVFKAIKFEIGAPLKPFEQLMGCLPPASSSLVPKPYRRLMCDAGSKIAKFYPTDFTVDMNGKKNPWEGVNLLPFINVELLRNTITEFCPDKVLTGDERARNIVGKVLLFSHDLSSLETIPSCNRDIGLPDIYRCNSRVDCLPENESTDLCFQPILIPGTKIPYPGFPSLNVLPLDSANLIPVGLNCFGTPSKYPTTILSMPKLPQLPGAENLASKVLDVSVFINWPMMHEAKVVAVTDICCEVRKKGNKATTVKKFSDAESERWLTDSRTIEQQYAMGNGIPGSGGVRIGEAQIRLRVVPLQGMKTFADGSTKKIFGKEEADVPLQMALWSAPAPDPRFVERGPMTLSDLYPVGCNVILTKGKHKGCIGTVVGVSGEKDEKKVVTNVRIIPPEPPFGLAIARSVKESYVSSHDAAKVLHLDPSVFGKITGSLSVDPGRYDLGLNLKYKEGLCVSGYTRKKNFVEKNVADSKKVNPWLVGDSLKVVGSSVSKGDDTKKKDRTIWEYTPQAIRLVAAYRQQFPSLFSAINRDTTNKGFYNAKHLFGPNGNEMLPKVRKWLNSIETAKLPRIPATTIAMPLSAIAAIQRAAEVRAAKLAESGSGAESNIRVPPSALYRENSTKATDVAAIENRSPPELGDRIANLCANGVPFGARGTVVSIHNLSSGCVEVVMDEEFIGGSNLQGSCANFRGKLCVWFHLLKISAADSSDLVEHMVPPKKSTASSDSCSSAVSIVTPKKCPSSTEFATKSNDEKDVKKHKIEDEMVTNVSTGLSYNRLQLKAVNCKQAGFKEASGPKGTLTFKDIGRKEKCGYNGWKKHISRAYKKDSINATSSTIELDAATKGLKDILGVTMLPQTLTEKNAVSGKSAGLKAMLGVGSTPDPKVVLPKEHVSATNSTTAADALMNLMLSESQNVPNHTSKSSPDPTFNFSYVQEGGNVQTIQQNTASKGMPFAQVAPPLGLSSMQMQGMQASLPAPKTIPRVKKEAINTEENGVDRIIPSIVASRKNK